MLRKLFTPVNLIGTFALVIALTGTAVAATGGNFILGQQNYAGTMTRLKNNGTGSALQLTTANASAAPLVVSNGTKVAKLNSDRLDSLDSTQLQRRVNGTCAAGSAVRVIASNGTVTCNAFQAEMARTVVISPGASATGNGTALLTVLTAITTASSSDPWLIKLEPGVFDLGTDTLTMKSFVDIEGSGPGMTAIRSAPATTTLNCIRNTVRMTDASELRDLTVEAYAVGAGCLGGVTFSTAGTARVTDVDIEVDATNSTNNSFGLSVGDPVAATLLADRVRVSVVDSPGSGFALYATEGVGTLEFVRGVAKSTGNVSNVAILRESTITRVGHSQAIGSVSGTPTCIGVYDATFLAMSC
jgi:hypothetical protein